MRRALLLLPALAALGGCAMFPRSAPTVNEVLADDAQSIAVVDIAMDTVSGFPADFAPLPQWAISDGPPRMPGVQPGDLLEITVFEVGYSLFANAGAASARQAQAGAGGGGYSFPALRVPEDGVIGLPFAGEIDASGLSGAQIAQAFERRLRGQSQNAQVLVSVQSGPRQSVVLSGDIEDPGRVVLTEDDERLLDAVALAGGPSARPDDTLVTLTREGISSVVRLTDITAGSPANVRLAPGDRIVLSRDKRSITVLGAAASVSEIVFEEPLLTLSEALARAGGPAADRADPTGVFIFRQEAGVDAAGMRVIRPVIYRLDLLDPRSYFAAQNFAMREGDVMLIADARGNRIQDFLGLVNALAAPVVTVDVLTR